ncbi:unnamed protein product [Brassica oleracea var. botrytis]|uniref:(rape) hypothetical protein n=1 Tax=Brassica napus TaxID=3708 RepID=A0A816Q0Y4_BRANA|nr:unnamed protein product [Brassica napus]
MEDVEQRFRECLCAKAENEQQISKPQGEVQSGRHDMKMMKGNILSEVRMRFQEFSKPIPQIYSSGDPGKPPLSLSKLREKLSSPTVVTRIGDDMVRVADLHRRERMCL